VYVLVVGVTSSNRLNASEAVDNLQSNAAAAEVDTGFSDISVTTTTSADEPSDAVVAPDYTGILIAALVSGVAVAAAAIVAYSKRKIIMNSDGKTYALPV
jgi:hypothetical protein